MATWPNGEAIARRVQPVCDLLSQELFDILAAAVSAVVDGSSGGVEGEASPPAESVENIAAEMGDLA